MSLHEPIKPYHFPNIQKVLPAVYDDSLSYYEVLCKVLDQLNQVTDGYNTLYNAMTALQNAWIEFESGGYRADFEEFFSEWVNENASSVIEKVVEEGLPEFEENISSRLNGIENTLSDSIPYYFNIAFKRNNGCKIYTIAHRGFRNSFVPENTIQAFEYACQCLPDLLETDIQFTSDDEMVCLHDADVSHYISQLQGSPSSFTLEQIQRYPINVGSGTTEFSECHIPTLSELLAVASKYNVPIAIEIKPSTITAVQLEKLKSTILQYHYTSNVLFTGSYINCLAIREIMPDAKCNVNISSVTQQVINNIRNGNFAAQLDINAATQTNIQTLITENIPFNVWFRGDVTSTAQYSTLSDYGVYAMFFDDVRQANCSHTEEEDIYLCDKKSRSEYMNAIQSNNSLLLCCGYSSGNLVPSYGNMCGIPKSIYWQDMTYLETFARLVLFECNIEFGGISLSEYNGDTWNNRTLDNRCYIGYGKCTLHWHNATQEIVGFYRNAITKPEMYEHEHFDMHILTSDIFFATTGNVGGSLINGNNIFTAEKLMVPISELVSFSFGTHTINDTYELVYGIYFYDSSLTRVTGVTEPYYAVTNGITTVGPYPQASDAAYYVIGFRLRNISTQQMVNFTSALDIDTYKQLIPVFKTASFANFREV